MIANISKELMDTIEERIYLDIEIHMYERKLLKAEVDNEGFANFLDKLIKKLISKRIEVNTVLRNNGVKIYDVNELDDMFIEYPYSVKINSGYKEGTMRFWRAAIKLKLKRRMTEYFTADGMKGE